MSAQMNTVAAKTYRFKFSKVEDLKEFTEFINLLAIFKLMNGRKKIKICREINYMKIWVMRDVIKKYISLLVIILRINQMRKKEEDNILD